MRFRARIRIRNLLSISFICCKSTCIAGDTPLEEGVMLVASGAHRDPRLRSLYAGYGASVAGSGTVSFIRFAFHDWIDAPRMSISSLSLFLKFAMI